MADRTRVSDLDFVYISFKEPNKEQNWADLKNKVPWAKRVDGVVGFDNAHKAAAELAETDFFISVDGDNVIDETFLLQTLDFEKTDRKAVLIMLNAVYFLMCVLFKKVTAEVQKMAKTKVSQMQADREFYQSRSRVSRKLTHQRK